MLPRGLCAGKIHPRCDLRECESFTATKFDYGPLGLVQVLELGRNPDTPFIADGRRNRTLGRRIRPRGVAGLKGQLAASSPREHVLPVLRPDLVDRLDSEFEGKKIVVLAAPGDRRDEDVRAVATRAAATFDHFICRRDDARRGRGDEEIPQLLKTYLLEAGVTEDRIEIVVPEPDAVNRAMEMAEAGDLLLLFCDQITRTWKQVLYFGTDRPETQPDVVAGPPPPQDVPHAELPREPSKDGWARDERGVFLVTPEED